MESDQRYASGSAAEGKHMSALGCEVTSFTEDLEPSGLKRLAVVVCWKGAGDSQAAVPLSNRTVAARFQPRGPRSPWEKLLFPLKLLLFVILMPVALIADVILSRRRQQRLSERRPVPMAPVVRTAKEAAAFRDGAITLGNQRFESVPHATLVLLVEEDPGQPDRLRVTERRIATEPYRPTGIEAADRDEIRRAGDIEAKRRVLMKLAKNHRAGEGQVFNVLFTDPVCRDFITRASSATPAR